MATAKKTTAPAKAAKPSASRAVALWEQDMADAAKRQAEVEKPFGNFKSVSLRNGVLAVDDNAVPDNELRVLVLCAAHENKFFPGRYDPNVPAVPACYAFGDLDAKDPEDTMKPHEEAEDPVHENCTECPNNVMGTAETGRGKACRNVRRLALVTEDALESADAMKEAEIRMLSTPVTSVGNWSNYVRNKLTDELGRPYWAVVTKVKLVPDAKSQFKLQFTFEENVDFNDELYAALKERIKEVRSSITAPYPHLEEQAAPPARGGRAQPMKPVGRAAQAMQKVPVKGAVAAKKSKY